MMTQVREPIQPSDENSSICAPSFDLTDMTHSYNRITLFDLSEELIFLEEDARAIEHWLCDRSAPRRRQCLLVGVTLVGQVLRTSSAPCCAVRSRIGA